MRFEGAGVTIIQRGRGFGVLVYDAKVRRKVWVGTYATREAAKTAETRATAERKVGRREYTCAEFTAIWIDLFPRPAVSTNTGHRNTVKPFGRDFANVLLREVTRPMVRPWALTQPLNSTYVLRTMFEDAIGDGHHPGPNPFGNLRRPQSRRRIDLDVLAENELYELIACAGRAWGDYGEAVFGPMIEFEAFVGLRPAELYFIDRPDVHADTGEVSVLRSDDSTGDPKRPKNENKRRVILPPPAAAAAARVPPRLYSQALFYTKTGRRFRKSSLYYYWNPVRTLFGRPDMDFHELRHFCGAYYTNVLEIDPADTAIQLGHTDGGRLVRTRYGHPEENAARERMKNAFRRRLEGF